MIKVTLSYIWVIFLVLSVFFSLLCGNGSQVSAAAMEGASQGIAVAIQIAGPLCLWSGVGVLLERTGMMAMLAKLLSPILFRLFPSAKKDPRLSGALSGNICANLLGLGNAATPMGIAAVQRLQDPKRPQIATGEMCRLVVMNTASIQLLPTTVAAVRAGAGAVSPFDILPCVWISSLLSVIAGLSAAFLLSRRWADD